MLLDVYFSIAFFLNGSGLLKHHAQTSPGLETGALWPTPEAQSQYHTLWGPVPNFTSFRDMSGVTRFGLVAEVVNGKVRCLRTTFKTSRL